MADLIKKYHGGLDIQTSGSIKSNGTPLLKDGDYGLGSGGIIFFTGDLNTLTTTGYYNAASASTNKPPAVTTGGKVTVLQRTDVAEVLQTFTENDITGAVKTWTRHYINDSWGSWILSYNETTAGTAATYDVTTTTVDSTTGRLLKVGDFGIGNVTPQATDANNAVVTGTWFTDGAASNVPVASVAGILSVAAYGTLNGRVFQTWKQIDTSPDTYVRSRAADGITWTSWRKQYNSETATMAPTTGTLTVGTTDASALIFNTTNTEVARLDASGHAIIPAGITLGTTVGTYNAANTLDDYEEGTWTPTIQGSTTAGTPSYTGQLGTYTKIGDTVTVTALVQGTWTTAGTGILQIAGLPFVSISTTNHLPAVKAAIGYATDTAYIYSEPGTSRLSFGKTGGVASALNSVVIDSTDASTTDFQLHFVLQYKTA